jgi:hypothetical protein
LGLFIRFFLDRIRSIYLPFLTEDGQGSYEIFREYFVFRVSKQMKSLGLWIRMLQTNSAGSGSADLIIKYSPRILLRNTQALTLRTAGAHFA